MPRFKFDVIGPPTVKDPHGIIFADCQVAACFANKLASELGAVRPELCGRASVVMTDEHRNKLTYCVAIMPARIHDSPGAKNPRNSSAESD